MKTLDWERLKQRYQENSVSHTNSGEEYVSRENLEKAVQLISNGIVLEGPSDYRRLVYDQRPAYAWAILKDMGVI